MIEGFAPQLALKPTILRLTASFYSDLVRPKWPTHRDVRHGRGFIGFENSGDLIMVSVAHLPSLNGWVLRQREESTSCLQRGQRSFHELHSNAVLLRANR